MKSASEYFKDRFGEEPKSDSDKLMCALMSQYAEYCKAEMIVLLDMVDVEKRSKEYMTSGRTTDGNDIGWIEYAYRDGMNDLIEKLKNNNNK